jgi:formate dehydrogenase accessory protein FdhE
MGENSPSAVAAPDYGRAEKVTRCSYLERIRRARELAAKYPFAAELLGYYARVLELQAAIADCLRSHGARNSSGVASFATRVIARDARDLLLSFAPPLAQIAYAAGPAPLADAAGKIGWPQLLDAFWTYHEASSAEERFFALALLQPYAERLAEDAHPPAVGAASNCPVCGTEAVVGVLRPEGFGARRSLVCSLCAFEWEFVRTTCPGCRESRPEAIGVYTSEQFNSVRVEACDTCKRYLKTVDLTKNGLAVPVVDELATIPLDLWAGENGYRKLCPNLFNM